MGFRRQLGWKYSFGVDYTFIKKKNDKGISRGGGLCLLCDDDTIVEIQFFSSSHIDSIVGDLTDPKRFRFTRFYGQPKVENRHILWTLLRTLSLYGNLSWVVRVI